MTTRSISYHLAIFNYWNRSCKSLITLGPSRLSHQHYFDLSSIGCQYQGKSVRQYVTYLANAYSSSSDLTSEDSDVEEHYVSEDFKTFFDGKKYGSKLTINRLKDVFKISRKNAEIIVQKFPGLTKITSENITESIKYFEKVDLNTELLRNNPWLLMYKTTAITSRLTFAEKMGLRNINDVVPLLQLPLQMFRDLSYKAQHEARFVPGGRIVYLSKQLECDRIDVCKVVAERTFLLTRHFDLIKSILDSLLRYGVSPKHILRDAWVFRYSPIQVESRLNKAHTSGVKLIKPWVVRTQETLFEKLIERSVESKNALGTNSTLNEYLSQRLECSTEHISALGLRYPPFSRVSVLKAKEILDYLYEEGFSPQHVCHVPRVLCHSLETVQERLNQIRDLGHNPNSLIVLCKSKRQYLEYINKLKQKQTFA